MEQLGVSKLGVGASSRVLFITQLSQHSLADQVEGYWNGGGRLLQVRIKDRVRVDVADDIRKLCVKYRNQDIRITVNDYVDIAQNLNLSGVHLGLEDLPVKEARRLLGDKAIIGATVHNVQELQGRDLELADYLGVGPFRFTQTKKRLAPILGLQGVERIVQAMDSMGLKKPVYVVGGVEDSDIRDLLSVGAYGVAISSCIALAQDVSFATRQILSTMTRSIRSK